MFDFGLIGARSFEQMAAQLGNGIPYVVSRDDLLRCVPDQPSIGVPATAVSLHRFGYDID
jgi:hypothetical protein